VIRSKINDMSHTLTIEYNDDLLYSLGVSSEQFSEEAKFLLAAKLYELGRLSSGEAARLAGKERVEFLFALNNLGLPISNLRAEDLAAELDFALNG
jgi:predicted HTH domain antitoxin